MICGMYSGLPVHEFEIKGHTVDVVRKDGKGIRAGINMKTGDIVVLVPPGISYHQAALEAVAALEAGKFHGREH